MLNALYCWLWDMSPAAWIMFHVLVFHIFYIPIYQYLKYRVKITGKAPRGFYQFESECNCCENRGAIVAALITFVMWLLSHYC